MFNLLKVLFECNMFESKRGARKEFQFQFSVNIFENKNLSTIILIYF